MPSAQQSPGVSPRAATRSVSAGATRPSRRRRSTNSRLRALARMRSASMPVRKPRFRNYSPTSKTTSDRLRSACSTPDRTSTSRYWIPPKSCSSRLGNSRASPDSLVGREAARVMVPGGHGTIFFTGATASIRGGKGFAAFSPAKFGLRAVAQAMARELGPNNIHVVHLLIAPASTARRSISV